MRLVREVLRYHYEKGLSREKIAGALSISKGAVHNTLNRFATSGLVWPLPVTLSDGDLTVQLYPKKEVPVEAKAAPVLDMVFIETELSRKHVTRELLYREYNERNPGVISRSAFYRYIRAHLPKSVDMPVIHKGGDLLYVDYSGDGIEYVDRSTGEVHEAQLFVCSWGASSYTYAYATATEDMKDFVMAHEHSFRHFGCVPQGLVPDNTKSAIHKANRYEPWASHLYQKFAEHYTVAILPARVRRPQDKATVESNVGFCQRYILGRLRNRTFFSIFEVNDAIFELLEKLNKEPMQLYNGQNRKERFERLDKPNAQSLRIEPFSIKAFKPDVTVGPNYHVRFEDHFYSVPDRLARQKVDVYLDGNIVEIYHQNISVARHRVAGRNFGYSTIPEHMPAAHRFVKGWSKEWFIEKAEAFGQHTKAAVKIILERSRHPQQGYNSALGVLNLSKKYTPERLEAAAKRALHFKSVTYKSIQAILESKLDSQPLATQEPVAPARAIDHENVRGAQYYAQTDIFEDVNGSQNGTTELVLIHQS